MSGYTNLINVDNFYNNLKAPTLLEYPNNEIESIPVDWYLAPALEILRSQINELAPNRSKVSDGSISDARHQSSKSDHNPQILGKNGRFVVSAIDITHDPSNCSAEVLAKSLVASRDNRIKYIIWNRQICSSTVSPWRWRPHKGSNPHTKHIHISVKSDDSFYDDQGIWVIKVL